MSTELAWKPRDSRLTHLACGDTIPATFGLFSVPALSWVSLRTISRQGFLQPGRSQRWRRHRRSFETESRPLRLPGSPAGGGSHEARP